MIPDRKCPKCGGNAHFSQCCGAHVCEECGNHIGLSLCFCGWSASGKENGRMVMEEMGEVIDEE